MGGGLEEALAEYKQMKMGRKDRQFKPGGQQKKSAQVEGKGIKSKASELPSSSDAEGCRC